MRICGAHPCSLVSTVDNLLPFKYYQSSSNYAYGLGFVESRVTARGTTVPLYLD
jgi:hypothetical protein